MFSRRQRVPDDDPVRRAAQYRVDRDSEREAVEGTDDDGPPPPARGAEAADGPEGADEAETVRTPRRVRPEDRARYVDVVVDQAIRRGEFDDLPLAGKPIPGLTGRHDPDWWLKSVIEREQLTGLGPPAMLLKTEDRDLDDRLDQELDEQAVRDILEDFNARVVDARRQLLGGPPVVTPTRDVETEVARWRARQAPGGRRS
ncbi:DnaJ family domain-containing protein [Cellulosimicrobium sp. Marseille-Q8652]